jgi:hypothetical protein
MDRGLDVHLQGGRPGDAARVGEPAPRRKWPAELLERRSFERASDAPRRPGTGESTGGRRCVGACREIREVSLEEAQRVFTTLAPLPTVARRDRNHLKGLKERGPTAAAPLSSVTTHSEPAS